MMLQATFFINLFNVFEKNKNNVKKVNKNVVCKIISDQLNNY